MFRRSVLRTDGRSRHANRAPNSRRPAAVQPLEPRVLFALVVDGTIGNDQIAINVVGPIVTVTVNGVPTSELDSLVNEIVVNGIDGDDTIRIGRNTDNAISVFAGEGDDLILVSDSSGSLSTLGLANLNIAVSGDGGTDRVELNDSARPEAAVHLIAPLAPNAARVTVNDTASSPLAPQLNLASIEQLRLRSGAGDDLLRVDADVPGVAMWLEGGPGDDLFEAAGDGGTSELAVTLTGGGGLDDVSVLSGGVEAVLEGTHTADFIRVDSGSRLRLDGGATIDDSVVTRALVLFGTGTLDVGRQTLLVDYTGPSPIAAIRQRVSDGYNFGTWTGSGITSSAAATTPGSAVGYADATELFTTFPNTFAGVPIDGTTLIVRYTISGDADLDRQVNIADFSRLATNFNTLSSWATGDFNFDNVTGIADFSLLAGNFNQSVISPTVQFRLPGGLLDRLLAGLSLTASAEPM